MSDGRTERLLALLLALTSAHRPLTRQAIRDAVGEYQGGTDTAFERKFERDKDELRRFGIPIKLTTDSWGEPVGYELERAEMFLPPLEFNSSERLVLTLAARAWGEGAISGLRKLETASGTAQPEVERLRVESRVDTHSLSLVMTAITERQAVSFSYRGAGDSAPKIRRVCPWAITAKHGHWYLVGWDQDRRAVRVFRVSRVAGRVNAEGGRRAFEIPADLELADVVKSDWDDETDVNATVRLAAGSGQAIRMLGARTGSTASHDVIQIEAVQPRTLIREVLRCGSTAQLLAPAAIVEDIRAALETLVANTDASNDLTAEQLSLLTSDAVSPRASTATQAVSKTRLTSSHSVDRLARLLALVPWLEANPGVTMSAAAAQFGLPPEQLREDLTLAVCTEFGAFHSTLDIDIYGSALTVRDSQGMGRPFRLSSHEAAALLLGLAVIRNALPGHEAATIDRVSAKLRTAAAALDDSVEHLAVLPADVATPPCEATIKTALEQSVALRIKYWSAARDALTERTISPNRLTWSDGRGYLEAWCHSTQERRTFRLNRILEATALDEPPQARSADPQRPAVAPTGPAAVLIVESASFWFVETVPHHRTIDLPDGRIVVSLPIASEPWAIRTVMALAGEVRVVAPVALAEQIIAEARAALAHY